MNKLNIKLILFLILTISIASVFVFGNPSGYENKIDGNLISSENGFGKIVSTLESNELGVHTYYVDLTNYLAKQDFNFIISFKEEEELKNKEIYSWENVLYKVPKFIDVEQSSGLNYVTGLATNAVDEAIGEIQNVLSGFQIVTIVITICSLLAIIVICFTMYKIKIK